MCGGGSQKQEMSESEKAQIDILEDQIKDSQKLKFIQDEYEKRIEELGTDQAQNQVMGLANVSAQNKSSDFTDAGLSSVTSRGVNPSSGAYLSTSQGLSDVGAETIGGSQQKAAYGLDSAYLQSQKNRIAMATGAQRENIDGLTRIAEKANSEARANAMNAFNERAANNAALGSVAGLAMGAYTNRNNFNSGQSSSSQGLATIKYGKPKYNKNGWTKV